VVSELNMCEMFKFTCTLIDAETFLTISDSTELIKLTLLETSNYNILWILFYINNIDHD